MEIPMGRANVVLAAVLTTLAGVGSAHAHHSGYMYATTPIWIEGRVVSFELRDPHTFTTLETTAADGTVRRWVVEGPGQRQLGWLSDADLPQVGETLQFCAHRYKEEWLAQFSSTDADGTPRQLIEGHVMLMPDGDRRFWDPHGLISECMRSSDDQRSAWLEFLRSDPRALDAWCQQQAYEAVRTNPELTAYVEEIDGLLEEPCR
jgi:hypothetical protein